MCASAMPHGLNEGSRLVQSFSRSVIPGYEGNSQVAPRDFDRLVSGYRLSQTALLGDTYWIYAIFVQ